MMITDLLFHLRGRDFSCEACIDNTEYPCLVFIRLFDRALIEEFGMEVTITTDFDKLLARGDDYPAIKSLRQALLVALQLQPVWIVERLQRIPAPKTVFFKG
ncbi:MAG: hypothetical protein EOP49_20215 [Sphingobacteriales bacterium]|nr:MAG: hypothetical protein EOP49_20215 [Sphingobacteriales bacterium]